MYRDVLILAVLAWASVAVAQKPETTSTVNIDYFRGTWTGSWDAKQQIEFNISPIDWENARVLYRWKENDTSRTQGMRGWLETVS